MVDPVGATLGGIALIGPAINTTIQAYGIYELSQNFGNEYRTANRRLNGQMARLKVLEKEKLSRMVTNPEDDEGLRDEILDQLAGMRRNFKLCNDLMKKYGMLSRLVCYWGQSTNSVCSKPGKKPC
jgi:hypothetical protein